MATQDERLQSLEDMYPLATINNKLNEIISSVEGIDASDCDLEGIQSSIDALASDIAGLSNVQSDLATISSSINALQSSVNAVGEDVAGLPSLEDIEGIPVIEGIGLLQSSLNNIQLDLNELLAASEVFQGNVVVNTPATLAAFHAKGENLAIVNGDVDIDVSVDMDIVMVQELVNFIQVVTGSFAYTAVTGVDTEVTFNNLQIVSGGSVWNGSSSEHVGIVIDQEGGYRLPNLRIATSITLDDDSSISIVDLRSLQQCTDLKNDGSGESGTFTFSSANELHLGSLLRSPKTSLSLGVDEGGVIDISSLTDVDYLGRPNKLILSISGPANFSSANISGNKSGSTMTFNNVGSVNLFGYDGTAIIGEGVLNFASDNLVDVSIQGNDLVTFNASGALDPNTTTPDTSGPAIDLSNQGNLETINLDGTFNNVRISSNGDLEAVTISAVVNFPSGIDINNNSDLTTISLTGSITDKVNIDSNSDLETLTIDHTTDNGAATTQEGTIFVNNNESLVSLTISTNNVDNLEITNNEDLETINLTGLYNIGQTGTPNVTIRDNNLSASQAVDLSDFVASGVPGDLGTFTTTSGLDTAKAYLTSVAADVDSVADVKFDLVESVIGEGGAEIAADYIDYPVLNLSPSYTDGGGTTVAAIYFSRVSWL